MYTEDSADADAYPHYTGNIFEKRVYSYLKNHNLNCGVYINTTYTHRNYPKKSKSPDA
jgi:hypothetical protein